MVFHIQHLLVVMVVTLPLLWLMERLHFPTLVAFLCAGVLIGPSGFALIPEVRAIEALAEIGIIALLFVLGAELPVHQMLALGFRLPMAGAIQMGLTTVLVGAVLNLAGWPPSQAILVGLAVSTTSTAVLLRVLQDRRETETYHGRWAIGLLLFQDMAVPLILIALPFLRAGAMSWGQFTSEVAAVLVRGGLIAGGAVAMARYGMPWLIQRLIAAGASVDFLRALVFVIGLGILWGIHALGWPLSIGAFLAGFVLSSTPIVHQIIAETLPLRDFLTGFFFLTLGMRFQLQLLETQPLVVLGITLALIGFKATATVLALGAVHMPVRTALTLAIAMPYGSEFSFLILEAALEDGLMPEEWFHRALASVFLSLMVGPFLAYFAPVFSLKVCRRFGWISPREALPLQPGPSLRHHVIIVGYGLNGENLATVLRAVQIPYCVVEMDPTRAQAARGAGHPIVIGDALYPAILIQAGIEDAHLVVLALADRVAAQRITQAIRRLNPGVRIIARVRFVHDVEPVLQAGADDVVPEEFETSIELFVRVLRAFRVPRNIIQLQVALIRENHYSLLRGLPVSDRTLQKISSMLAASVTELFRVLDDSPVVGKSLGALNLRGRGGATVIAVVRNEQVSLNPGADFTLAPGDTLVMVGSHAQLNRSLEILEGREAT